MAKDANLVVPGPFHSVDATDALICKLREGTGKRIPSACLKHVREREG